MRAVTSTAAARLILAPCIAAAWLAGCAGFSPDGGMGAVRDITGAAVDKQAVALRGSAAEVDAAREAVQRLLARPLSADTAVKIALLNNRALQASYNALGMAEATMVEASLPPDPGFSISDAAGGGGLDIERRIVADILALATLPARAEIAADRFRQAQLQAALILCAAPPRTRRAYLPRRRRPRGAKISLTRGAGHGRERGRGCAGASARAARSTSSIRRATRSSTPN